jgi:5'-nucleotidase
VLLLLTNDDGIESQGLWSLARKAMTYKDFEVFIVAPDRERSGSGHAISIHRPIEIRKVDKRYERVTAFSTSGTPADCVKLAVEGLMDRKPDLVLSGINRGPNLGTDVFYSGTVSAAMEGALLGIRSVAVSVTSFEDVNYEVAAEFAVDFVRTISTSKSFPKLVNINVPSVDADSIAGVAVTRLGVQTYRDTFSKRIDPQGRTWYWLGGTLVEGNFVDDTDTCAIQRNLISITPLLTDLTDVSSIEMVSDYCPTYPKTIVETPVIPSGNL